MTALLVDPLPHPCTVLDCVFKNLRLTSVFCSVLVLSMFSSALVILWITMRLCSLLLTQLWPYCGV